MTIHNLKYSLFVLIFIPSLFISASSAAESKSKVPDLIKSDLTEVTVERSYKKNSINFRIA
ncbi:Uncharacterized protein dnl_61080 [Desulfonema limicola]|uniref:Uncharacterized protein n=1 Tax=Desulfonema limicola TaxID=45656 RepID=A0A975BEJ0_9BACT|nr:Uncharacterized protein dnl_61080 [Desulfonema limicola]